MQIPKKNMIMLLKRVFNLLQKNKITEKMQAISLSIRPGINKPHMLTAQIVVDIKTREMETKNLLIIIKILDVGV